MGSANGWSLATQLSPVEFKGRRIESREMEKQNVKLFGEIWEAERLFCRERFSECRPAIQICPTWRCL